MDIKELRRFAGLSAILLVVCIANPAVAQDGSNLTAVGSVFSIGGGTGQTAGMTIGSTAGQLAVGRGQLGDDVILHGFWSAGGFPFVQSCCGQFTGGFTGNIDCDANGRIDLIDITRLVDHLFIGNPPLCCDEDGNVNGSSDGKITLSDIARLIDHVYLSKEATAACQ